MLVNLTQLLTPAHDNKYAVAAFDVVNVEYASAIVRAAELENSPVIIMVYEGYFRYFNMELLIPALLKIGAQAKVPVVVHLDHASSVDIVVKAINSGCTSVMIDGSCKKYEENVVKTREVVQMCKRINVSVEAEIGNVGGDEAIGQAILASSKADERYYTNIDQAVQFVQDTHVDALAVSVGNVHGLYKGEPKLDFERIEKIASHIGIPLVLHGGSGISDEDFQNAIKKGMAKININTALILAAGSCLKNIVEGNQQLLNFPELLYLTYETVGEQARHFMRIFGCAGKA
jgi:fructose-bisphosphate aldolase class II